MSEKETKAEAHYRSGSAERCCEHCTMFRPPPRSHLFHGACSKVEGAISPEAVCDYFEAKTVGHG